MPHASHASQHISPHHAAPCSTSAVSLALALRPVELRKLRKLSKGLGEGPSRLQSDVGQSTSEGTSERG